MQPKHWGGFSMIELMVVVLLASIIMNIAVPSLVSIYNRITFESLQKNLISHLSFARAEALKQGSDVSLCPSADGATCLSSSSNWKDGWLIFLDINGNGSFDASDDELIKGTASPSIANIFWTNTTNPTFQGDGTVMAGRAGSMKICDFNGDYTVIRGVTVSTFGRITEDNTVTCP
ncbi:GspH/FimT family pseudopilin [Endozoicomonas ascidiicola]|uniref:GspH/FimT family pseudopilin n=1 Tax=Endozoicomonas ascidiicola TaxID=1698521 RepID=UPI000834AD1B|nr:GspH/FimT family pseudopilin [Endozoicomonas ascidiicola]